MTHPNPQQPESNEAASGSSRSQRRGRTGFPWLWLGVAFLVVLILAAIVLWARQHLPAQPSVMEPTSTPTLVQPTATPRPPTPTSTPEPTVTPTPTPVEIGAGIEVEVVGTGIDGLSFRSGPGINYARLKIAHDGEIFTVLDGPEEAGDYRWWHLEDTEGITGWAVEDYLQPDE
ncbi:MAG: SH3 domain-containing protein [Chloroflexota bacterium]|nr:SH3 domain-containing protein [Chloroflexota bacterium]